ncbi:MAG: hypothetical protein OEO18_02250 [Gammaproteobacteria bacterium]|nr:hypothetical protein [Gammaproteobacteria bacterium]
MAVALLLFAIPGLGLLNSCAQVRKATYPKDFIYLDKKQVKSQMAMFGFYMRQLDSILLDETAVSSEQQAQIVSLLNKIRDGASSLGSGNVTTNHLVIDDHIDEFISDVNTALRNASADPPNYFALGKLSGSCVGCHKYR